MRRLGALLGLLVWLGVAQAAPAVQSLELGPVSAYPGALAVSGDGRVAAHVGPTGDVSLWDTAAARALAGAPVMPRASAVGLSHDGRWLAVGQADGRLQLWSRTEPAAPPREFRGHSGRISALTFSADDRLLASASADGSTQVFDTSSAQRLKLLDSLYNGHATEGVAQPIAVAFAAGDRLLLTQDWRQRQYDSDRVTTLWSLPQAIEISQQPATVPNASADSLPASQAVGGGGWLWAYSGPDHLMVQRLDGCAEPRALPPIGYADTVAVDPQGRWVAESRGDALNFVSLADGRQAPLPLPGRVLALTPLPDGRTMLAVLTAWSAKQGRAMYRLPADDKPSLPARLYRVTVPPAATAGPPLAIGADAQPCAVAESASRAQTFTEPKGLAPLAVAARLVPAIPPATGETAEPLGPPAQLRFDASRQLQALYMASSGYGAGLQVWQLATRRSTLARRLVTQAELGPPLWLGKDWAVHGPGGNWVRAASDLPLLGASSEYTPNAAVSADDITQRLYRVAANGVEQVTAEGRQLPTLPGRSAIAGIAARNGRLLVHYRDGGMELFAGEPPVAALFRAPPTKSNPQQAYDDWALDDLMLSADGRYLQYVANPASNETVGADAAWRLADGKRVGTGTPVALLPARANRVVTLDTRAHRLAVWDFDRNEVVARLPRQRSRSAEGMPVPLKGAISDDGRRVASASPDGLVRVWDVDAHRLLGEARVGAEVTALAFDAAGRQLAVGHAGGEVWVLALP